VASPVGAPRPTVHAAWWHFIPANDTFVAIRSRRGGVFSRVAPSSTSPRTAMTSQRFAPVAAVALAAVLSAAFVAVAAVPAQGLGADDHGSAAALRDASSVSLAIGAGSLVEGTMRPSRAARPGGA
jgi:hypothetical protein